MNERDLKWLVWLALAVAVLALIVGMIGLGWL
jgi:hypothetical protein